MRRVQISCDICTRFARYLYSTKQSWIINGCLDPSINVKQSKCNAKREILKRFVGYNYLPKVSSQVLTPSVKPRLPEQFLCDNFYATNTFDRVDGTANIRQQFNV